MTATHDPAEADLPERQGAVPQPGTTSGTGTEAGGPPRAQRLDVRRRLMALRRW